MSCTETLREKGYRLTPQRMMIFSSIHESDHHISAEEIYEQIRARYPNVNISTVYRTLELLKKLGLVSEIELDGVYRYHHADKGHHHHLICRKCGRVLELDEAVLEPVQGAILRKYGFKADLSHLAVLGTCVKCRK